ncbi:MULTISPECIES: hypothetical protein [unclassified Bradyrhizobium]
MDFTVVVVGYNRPHSLRRLLKSLANAAEYAERWPPIIISIDYGGGQEWSACVQYAEHFDWPGTKHVVIQPVQLGLRKHVLTCCNLSRSVGNVLVFEDDLCVSRAVFQVADELLAKYGTSSQVAGISLYSHMFNEFAEIPFVAVNDGWDVFFAQTGSSWGQMWTRTQWVAFDEWLSTYVSDEGAAVPREVLAWSPQKSWKRFFNMYLAKSKQFVVYPRVSMSTNMGDRGVNLKFETTHLTVALGVGASPLRLPELHESLSVYDPFLEFEAERLKRLVPALRGYEFDVDLTGEKPVKSLRRPFVLTCRGGHSSAAIQYGFGHFPPELNVIFEEQGNVFRLAPRSGIEDAVPRDVISRMKNFYRIRSQSSGTQLI